MAETFAKHIAVTTEVHQQSYQKCRPYFSSFSNGLPRQFQPPSAHVPMARCSEMTDDGSLERVLLWQIAKVFRAVRTENEAEDCFVIFTLNQDWSGSSWHTCHNPWGKNNGPEQPHASAPPQIHSAASLVLGCDDRAVLSKAGSSINVPSE